MIRIMLVCAELLEVQLMVPMNVLSVTDRTLSSSGIPPPVRNSSPVDSVVIVEHVRLSGRSPILTQDEVAGQKAWTAVVRLVATAS